MFENSHTAEEKLQELLKQYGVTEIQDASDGLYFGYGTSPKCIFCFHKESEDGSKFQGNENNNKNIRVEVFPDYDVLRKNDKFFERMKNDCLEGECFERLGKLVDWYENGTDKNAPHPADMYYSESIDVVDDNSVWYLEDDIVQKPKLNLKPFDKVIVRRNHNDVWHIDLFSNMDKDKYVCLLQNKYEDCLPYNEETAKLIGTFKDYKES